MRYCPNCRAEYRDGFDRCRDCDLELVAEPPFAEANPRAPIPVDLHAVYSTGRRIDAEVVRSMLEGHGFDARIWGAGMGPWRMESALTEVTGIPNAFNSYRVVVRSEDVEDARRLLDDVETDLGSDVDAEVRGGDGRPTFMDILRSRWALVIGAGLLLALVLLFGAPEVTA